MIDWGRRRARVEQILEEHPPESGACADAARELLPLASDVDSRAQALLIEPRAGIYVAPKHPVGRRWLHHVTVEVSEHCVDALTGAEGHASSTYLPEFFQFPDHLWVRPVDDHEWEVL